MKVENGPHANRKIILYSEDTEATCEDFIGLTQFIGPTKKRSITRSDQLVFTTVRLPNTEFNVTHSDVWKRRYPSTLRLARRWSASERSTRLRMSGNFVVASLAQQ